MPVTIELDDDLAELVEKLAERKPFEELSFSDALRRVLSKLGAIAPATSSVDLEFLFRSSNGSKKAPSPSVEKWVASVPDLAGHQGLNSWQRVCEALNVETGGDSARRRLKYWVKIHRPTWPQVPELPGDA